MKFFDIFFEKKIVADCGHEVCKKGVITAFGKSCTTEIKFVDDKTPFCHKCLEKMAVQCPWCGGPIFIGDMITLYIPSENFIIPKSAAVYNRDPVQLVGCQTTSCASSGADYAGTWMPPGKVVLR